MKASKIINQLEKIIKDFGDLEVVEIEWTGKFDNKIPVHKISPCVIINPNDLKSKQIIFD